MTPFSNPGNESEIRYNYNLRSTRMSVECCFGVLKKNDFLTLIFPYEQNCKTP